MAREPQRRNLIFGSPALMVGRRLSVTVLLGGRVAGWLWSDQDGKWHVTEALLYNLGLLPNVHRPAGGQELKSLQAWIRKRRRELRARPSLAGAAEGNIDWPMPPDP